MQRFTIPLMALYRSRPTMFDGFTLPEGLNKNDLVDRLILEIGELEATYTNPLVMQDAIGFWSRSRVEIWQKIYDIMTYEYNPIWNVDGETWHDGTNESHGTGKTTSERDYTRAETANDHDITERDYTRARTESGTDTDDATTDNYISADNSSGWSPDTRTVLDDDRTMQRTEGITDNDDTDETRQHTGSITDNDNSEVNTKDDRFGADNWHERRQGNIGVTMTQQLLAAEKDLWEGYDIYEYIIQDFKQEFCIMVW